MDFRPEPRAATAHEMARLGATVALIDQNLGYFEFITAEEGETFEMITSQTEVAIFQLALRRLREDITYGRLPGEDLDVLPAFYIAGTIGTEGWR